MSKCRQILISAIAAVIVNGCGDSPSGVALRRDVLGTYVLRTVDGQPLPVEQSSNASARVIVLADTLVLGPSGIGKSSTGVEIEYRQRTTPQTAVGRSEYEMRYTLEGTFFTARFLCDDIGDCEARPDMVGTLTSGELRITQAGVNGTSRIYERVTGWAGTWHW